MSYCYGGDTCTRGRYDPWEPGPWDRERWNDRGRDPGYGDDGGGGGGGGGGGNDPGPQDSQPVDPHTVRDAITTLSQLQVALKELLATKSLSATQIGKIQKIVSAINDGLSLLNTSSQLTEHTNVGPAVAEVLAFAASIIVGTAASTAGLPAILAVLAGAATAYTTEYLANRAFDQLEQTYSEFQEAVPEDWEFGIVCRIGRFCDDRFFPPIVLDMDGDGVELLAKDESLARLDIDRDGYLEKVSWVKGDDAILYIDHNNSGAIDNYNEFSFASFAGRGASDLEGLRTFDTNADGVFDKNDESFSQSGIWQDKNEDAVQDEGELTTLSEAGIVSISLSGDSAMNVVGDSVIANNMTYTKQTASGSILESQAGDVLFSGSVSSGIKKFYIDDVNVVVEHESGMRILDYKEADSDLELYIGDEEYFGVTEFHRVLTGTGNDIVTSTSAHKLQIDAGDGNDTVYGNHGNDFIRGGAGDDVLSGGSGYNQLLGGEGKDTFIIGEGNDRILDFDSGSDFIQINGTNGLDIDNILANTVPYDRGTELHLENGNIIQLVGVEEESLSSDDFILVE